MLSATQISQLLADFDGHMDWNGGWGVVMIIGMAVFWGLVIAAAVWLVRDLTRARSSSQPQVEQPLDVLDRRLAEGTISIEEYQERRNLLDRRP
jgi:putative membrane protein